VAVRIAFSSRPDLARIPKVTIMTKTTLRLGGYQSEASVHTRALRLMAADLSRRLGGDAEVTVTPNVAALGHKAADVLTMVAGDAMDICYFQSSYLDVVRVPSLRVLDLPFLISDRADIYAKLDGAFGARLAADVAAGTPYLVLAYWDNGFRHLSNRLRPLRTPADCVGLRIRTTASPVHQEIFAAFGFIPISIDPSELAQAVATEKVDAQENPLTNLMQFGINRYHKHISLSAHFFGCAPLLINRARYDALPRPAQDALQAAVKDATRAQREFAIAEDTRCIEILRAENAQIVPQEAIDLAAFKAAARPIVEREAKIIGEDVLAMLEA
jgi:tripartite ATP-independent transporter DctP family solute receptor